MSELLATLKEHNFTQGSKPFEFIRKTDDITLTLLFQPLRRTKYVGELRYREWVGCRVVLSTILNIPSRFLVIDRKIASGAFISWLNKKKGNQKIEGIGDTLNAWARSKKWSEAILTDRETTRALGKLFSHNETSRRQQSLSLDPRRLSYAYRMQVVDPATVVALTDPFLTICRNVKTAPDPPEKISLSVIEKLTEKHPFVTAILFLFFALFLLLVPFVLIGGIYFLYHTSI